MTSGEVDDHKILIFDQLVPPSGSVFGTVVRSWAAERWLYRVFIAERADGTIEWKLYCVDKKIEDRVGVRSLDYAIEGIEHSAKAHYAERDWFGEPPPEYPD